jgi:hypothetical protein
MPAHGLSEANPLTVSVTNTKPAIAAVPLRQMLRMFRGRKAQLEKGKPRTKAGLMFTVFGYGN